MRRIIRVETAADHRAVEELTREAFWNVNVPGCGEHYLVHTLRDHPDFIPELDLVCEQDGELVGSILFTRSRLVDKGGRERTVLTFGPLSVRPDKQRRGIGKRLVAAALKRAEKLDYGAVVIFGGPANYVPQGFVSCKRYNVCLEGTVFPTALLVKELKPRFFDGRKWYFHESPAYEIDPTAAQEFDEGFPPREKVAGTPSQEEFFIYSHSVIR